MNHYNAKVVWRRLFKPTVPAEPYQFRSDDFVRTSKFLGEEKRSQECQGYLVTRRVNSHRPGAFLVRRCQLLPLGRFVGPESQGSFLRASTAKGQRPAQLLACGPKAKIQRARTPTTSVGQLARHGSRLPDLDSHPRFEAV